MLDEVSLFHPGLHGLHGREVVVDALALPVASASRRVAAAETELEIIKKISPRKRGKTNVATNKKWDIFTPRTDRSSSTYLQ